MELLAVTSTLRPHYVVVSQTAFRVFAAVFVRPPPSLTWCLCVVLLGVVPQTSCPIWCLHNREFESRGSGGLTKGTSPWTHQSPISTPPGFTADTFTDSSHHLTGGRGAPSGAGAAYSGTAGGYSYSRTAGLPGRTVQVPRYRYLSRCDPQHRLCAWCMQQHDSRADGRTPAPS